MTISQQDSDVLQVPVALLTPCLLLPVLVVPRSVTLCTPGSKHGWLYLLAAFHRHPLEATSALHTGGVPGLAAALLGALAQSALPLLSVFLSNQSVGWTKHWQVSL